MATRQDDNIYKCAKRMVEKYEKGKWTKLNGEYSRPVQIEIERMKNHCRDKPARLPEQCPGYR